MLPGTTLVVSCFEFLTYSQTTSSLAVNYIRICPGTPPCAWPCMYISYTYLPHKRVCVCARACVRVCFVCVLIHLCVYTYMHACHSFVCVYTCIHTFTDTYMTCWTRCSTHRTDTQKPAAPSPCCRSAGRRSEIKHTRRQIAFAHAHAHICHA